MKQKKTFLEKLKAAGPAAIITSAFIGPGTITTSTNAGVNFGYALLWAVLFSGIASIVIMNIASRLAVATNKNIIEASVEIFPNNAAWKKFILGLIALVCVLTGLGFEAGNLIGATTGFANIFNMPNGVAALAMGLFSLYAIIRSTPKLIETLMKYFVALMGFVFILTSIIAKPNVGDVLKGFIPSIPEGSMVTTIALIGTTIIGINLVYHSIAATDKYTTEDDLEDSYFDTNLNVMLGVLMTMAVVITTSATLYGTGTVVDSPIVYAASLEMTLGKGARMFAATGLVLAGLSSAIATPFMVGQICARIFGWDQPNDKRPTTVASLLVVFGMGFAMFGKTPVPIILFAQATSGVFLPVIAVLFLIVCNNKEMGKYKNTTLQNILTFITVVVMFVLGGRTVWNVLSRFF